MNSHRFGLARLSGPAIRSVIGCACGLGAAGVTGTTTLYSFGNPTADEQALIESVNRARANPTTEGQRLAQTTDPELLGQYASWSVDKTMLQSELAAIAAAAPLAPNAALTTCARSHSQWMLTTATQEHDENASNANVGDPFQRMTAAGYGWSTAGENIFAYGRRSSQSHAAFEVDWGSGSGGMLTGRGHRVNIHNAAFREIGVGVVSGSNTVNSNLVGPQLVTEDFGNTFAAPVFATGVAYYDLNSNNSFDPGEGIAGLTVTVTGASYYCLSADGGGWVVPVPATAATRTVNFSGNGINSSVSLTLAANTSAKTDLKLAYARPTITSAATATAGSSFTFTYQPGAGAASHVFRRAPLAAAATENCESTANVTATIDATSYNLLSTTVKQQGTGSFHLAHATTKNQSFQLNPTYFGGTAPQLAFQSFLRYATTTERALVQVQEEGAADWTNVYSQAGSNGSTDAAFTARSVSLSAFANKRFHVRFLYQYDGNSLYQGSGDQNGWFVDAIQFTDVSALGTETAVTLAGTTSVFTPVAGRQLLSVAPVISSREFPPATQVLNASALSGFAAWATTFETANSLPAGTLANNPTGDYDHDGRSNLREYAFGTSPVSPTTTSPREPVVSLNATNFVLSYQRDTSLTDITFTPQASTDGSTWAAPGEAGEPSGFTDVLVSTAAGIETREARIPRTSGQRFLCRIHVSRP